MNTELKNTEYTTGKAPNQDWKPVFPDVPWLNVQAIDYKMLKNRP